MTATDQQKGAVIVTGASRGIGAAIAQKLAGERARWAGRAGPTRSPTPMSWLVSPEASFVTGSDITVSGGL